MYIMISHLRSNLFNIIKYFLIFLFLASCSKAQICSFKDKKLDYKITPKNKQQLLDQLAFKIRSITNLDHPELLIKQDLLRIDYDDTQFENCPLSSLYIKLHKPLISRRDFYNYYNKIDQKIDDLRENPDKFYYILSQHSNDKIEALKRLLLSIDEENPESKIIDINFIKSITINQDHSSNSIKELNRKLYLLSTLTNIAEKMPIMLPIENSRIMRNFGIKVSPITLKDEFFQATNLVGYYNKNYVNAAGSGKIIHAGIYSNLGNSVIIDHGNNIQTIYARMEPNLLVKKGKEVTVMEPLGIQGESGRNSIGSFLYYQILINGSPIDPRKFFIFGKSCNYGI